jgi:hypothetical protein
VEVPLKATTGLTARLKMSSYTPELAAAGKAMRDELMVGLPERRGVLKKLGKFYGSCIVLQYLNAQMQADFA